VQSTCSTGELLDSRYPDTRVEDCGEVIPPDRKPARWPSASKYSEGEAEGDVLACSIIGSDPLWNKHSILLEVNRHVAVKFVFHCWSHEVLSPLSLISQTLTIVLSLENEHLNEAAWAPSAISIPASAPSAAILNIGFSLFHMQSGQHLMGKPDLETFILKHSQDDTADEPRIRILVMVAPGFSLDRKF
jgi:hypothetical protein